jgi:acetylornithine deacetylase/succinyl-diaminopimelate desuccinylase-like protein
MSAERAQEAIRLLQRLLRVNTVNPPGNERPAQELLMSHLRDAGVEVALVGETTDRPRRWRCARSPERGGDRPAEIWC